MPFDREVDLYVRRLLGEGGVEVRNGVGVGEVDYVRREVVLKGGERQKYGAFYQYLPMKTP